MLIERGRYFVVAAVATLFWASLSSDAVADPPGYRHGGFNGGYSSHYFRGGRYDSFRPRGYYGGLAYPRTGVNISIGSYPFGFGYNSLNYRGLGYSGLGYSGLGYSGLGYSGVGLGFGYSSFGVGSFGFPYSSAFSRYDVYGLGWPGYAGRPVTSLYASPLDGFVPVDRYVPSYDMVPQSRALDHRDLGYGVPGYESEFSHRPSTSYPSGSLDELYDAPRGSALTDGSDLRPGMVLPDGSKVISVGPLGVPANSEFSAPGTNPNGLPNEPTPAEMPKPAIPEKKAEPAATDYEELPPAANPELGEI